jgi:hypothetical protein
MSAASKTRRFLVASVVASLTVTGCQTLDDAGRVIGRADLVNDLAARMDRAWELTYSADYQLSGGRSASISQSSQPPRSAYLYPGGKVTVDEEAVAECDTSASRPVCVLTPPSIPSAKPSVRAFTEAKRQGMITPPLVMSLLTAAALDPGAVVTQNDTTVAGQHATCVEVDQVANAAATRFQACVTADGVLGSFTGEVDGKPMEQALSRYRTSVDGTAFDLPAGAGVVDRRPATT